MKQDKMWIRTECGIIKQTNDVNYFKYLTVKKQGDNLIDVLEEWDMFVNKDRTPMFYTEHSIKLMIIGSGEKYSKEEIIDRFIMEGWEIITHEQYMPLLQEVKC